MEKHKWCLTALTALSFGYGELLARLTLNGGHLVFLEAWKPDLIWSGIYRRGIRVKSTDGLCLMELYGVMVSTEGILLPTLFSLR